MNRVRVKMCGMTRPEDARLAAALGADAVGFVFWPGSPRAITPVAAAVAARDLPPFVCRVGVFVNAARDQIQRAIDTVGLHAVQLHGDETVEECHFPGVDVIKAGAARDDADERRLQAWPQRITVLVDAADPERRGGTGHRADWTRAARIAKMRPVILAGGLRPEVVEEAIRQVHPYAVDVSSGVEVSPGVKDPGRMRAFIDAVRRAAQEVS